MWYSRQADRERAESEADIENRTTTIKSTKYECTKKVRKELVDSFKNEEINKEQSKL